MIQVEKLSYGFPAKELYENISFTLEAGRHCALIGSNGAGKSTLVDMLMNRQEYLYDGKIIIDESCRVGYAGQFSVRDKGQDCTVFAYLSRRFTENQRETEAVCDEMARAGELEPEAMEAVFAKYQALLDAYEAMDGDHYESNIRKQLAAAGMKELENARLPELSGGEYKLLQIMREMLTAPNLLILDEPDVFLDFGNLNGLCRLINGYKGTLLAVTHNRYLLNHCFDKVLHLENGDLQEFDGNYTQYRCSQLREKLRLKLQSDAEQDEIARTQEMVNILRKRATDMVNPVIGRSVNAKQSQLDRLRARQIKAPFIEVREPKIQLPDVAQLSSAGDRQQAQEDEAVKRGCETAVTAAMTEAAEMTETEAETDGLVAEAADTVAEAVATADETGKDRPVLKVTDYEAAFDEHLLDSVSFELFAGEKVAIVGENGTGKTTLIRDILKNDHPAVEIDKSVRYACLSQLQSEDLGEEQTVWELLQEAGFASRQAAAGHLEKYCLQAEMLDQKAGQLSGGEQNLLQLALLEKSEAELLILDEPTSHLDIYAQTALEKAVSRYRGTVLMVSHDFYLAANCVDYVLLVENNTVRRMRTRNFRKMVYEKYFDQKYLETDRKKQQMEADITRAFQRNDLAAVEKLCDQLDALSFSGEN